MRKKIDIAYELLFLKKCVCTSPFLPSPLPYLCLRLEENRIKKKKKKNTTRTGELEVVGKWGVTSNEYRSSSWCDENWLWWYFHSSVNVLKTNELWHITWVNYIICKFYLISCYLKITAWKIPGFQETVLVFNILSEAFLWDSSMRKQLVQGKARKGRLKMAGWGNWWRLWIPGQVV